MGDRQMLAVHTNKISIRRAYRGIAVPLSTRHSGAAWADTC